MGASPVCPGGKPRLAASISSKIHKRSDFTGGRSQKGAGRVRRGRPAAKKKVGLGNARGG